MFEVFLLLLHRTIVARGKRVKRITCASCSQDYLQVVELHVERTIFQTAIFELFAGERYRRGVADELSKRLSKYEGDKPCPGCGDYQPSMFKQLGKREFDSMDWGTVLCVILALVAWAIAIGFTLKNEQPNDSQLIAVLSVIIPGAFFLGAAAVIQIRKAKRISTFDPNVHYPLSCRLEFARLHCWSVPVSESPA